MSMVVLMVHGMDTSTNVLLLGLTLSDLCYLLTMFARSVQGSEVTGRGQRKASCLVSHVDVTAGRTLETALIPNVYMVNRVFSYITPFLTMLITLERCLAVTLPLKVRVRVQSIVTSFRMKLAVASIYVFSTVAQFPFFFIYEIQWGTDVATGQTIPRLRGTRFFTENMDAITAYNNIALSAIFNYLPMTVVVVCTAIVITTIKRSSRWRKITSQGGDRPEERRMTRLLMTVVAVYIACYIPRCAVLIANSLAPDTFNSLGGRYGNLFYLISAFQLLLFGVNSSCNFVIYMVMSSKFYHTYVSDHEFEAAVFGTVQCVPGKGIFLCRKQHGGRKTTAKYQSSASTGVTSLTSAHYEEASGKE
ncbi:uncharacterized protein LOC143290296 [Babylonia areolata]|uniref:uncharacterized protein LOC143290296 n=1 Tax=Babylonia areolata TaxID=304850 RepID=UPI003FD031B9